MSYLISQRFYNGYRCKCCYREWVAGPEFAQDLQSAYKFIFPFRLGEDTELKEIEIKECNFPNETVAKATVEWPSPNNRHPSRYKYTYFSGWIQNSKADNVNFPFSLENERICQFEPEIIKFNFVYDGEMICTRTRQEIDAEVIKEISERELQNAKVNLENTVKKLNELGLNVHGFIDKK